MGHRRKGVRDRGESVENRARGRIREKLNFEHVVHRHKCSSYLERSSSRNIDKEPVFTFTFNA